MKSFFGLFQGDQSKSREFVGTDHVEQLKPNNMKYDEIPGDAPSPLDVGRAGWTILHSIAAKYPMRPEPAVQARMHNFLDSFVSFYPCDFCSTHMQEEIQKRETASRSKPSPFRDKLTLSSYICELHNSVNALNGKPAYSCAPEHVLRRWHPTFPDIDDEPGDDDVPSDRKQESGKVSDDETDPMKIMQRLKKCEVWCPRED